MDEVEAVLAELLQGSSKVVAAIAEVRAEPEINVHRRLFVKL